MNRRCLIYKVMQFLYAQYVSKENIDIVKFFSSIYNINEIYILLFSFLIGIIDNTLSKIEFIKKKIL